MQQNNNANHNSNEKLQQIYNTSNKTKVNFVPLEPDEDLYLTYKDLKILQKKSIDRILLRIETMKDVQINNQVKEDKKNYIKYVMNTFNIPQSLTKIKKNIKKKVKKAKLNQKELGLEKESSGEEHYSSQNIWDSDFGDMSDHFEESNERDYDDQQDDYD